MACYNHHMLYAIFQRFFPFLLGMVGVVFCALNAEGHVGALGYVPVHKKVISSLSDDQNTVFYFEKETPVLIRHFRGKRAKERCAKFKNILRTGVGPALLSSDETTIGVQYVNGRHFSLEELCSHSNLTAVIDALQAFYDGLRSIQDELPVFTLLNCARQKLEKMQESDVKSSLQGILDEWEEKFSERLQATGLGVVHGDLHTRNMLWDGARLWLLDYEFCGRGYVLEDIALLSVYGALTKELEDVLLDRLFAGEDDGNVRELFEACKALVRFAWNVGSARVMRVDDVRSILHEQRDVVVGAKRFAEAVIDVNVLPLEAMSDFLTASVWEMRQLVWI